MNRFSFSKDLVYTCYYCRHLGGIHELAIDVSYQECRKVAADFIRKCRKDGFLSTTKIRGWEWKMSGVTLQITCTTPTSLLDWEEHFFYLDEVEDGTNELFRDLSNKSSRRVQVNNYYALKDSLIHNREE